MKHINYFKSEAKKLLKDLKTRVYEKQEGEDWGIYTYPNAKFFDLDSITSVCDFDEDREPSLMSAQHMIAVLAGFESWNQLIKAPEKEREFAALIFENQNIYSLEDWADDALFLGRDFRAQGVEFDLDLQMSIYKARVEHANGEQIGTFEGFKLGK